MAQGKNLDDQSFEDIMDYVMDRLPWLCPAWTDYNAHDPGITVLELIAWYKEMQQFHLNQTTDLMRLKLLKLVGARPYGERAAECHIELEGKNGPYPALSRLESGDRDITFELAEPARGGAKLGRVYAVWGGEVREVGSLLAQPGISIEPFDYSGQVTQLYIGLVDLEGSRLKIWFDVDDKREVPRNPFMDQSQAPRRLEWSLVGTGPIVPVEDGTHALSVSGCVVFEYGSWPVTDGGLGLEAQNYLALRLAEGGCEENVRLRGISAGKYRVIQRETRAKLERLRLPPQADARVELADEVSLHGRIFAFLRTVEGLLQVECTSRWEPGRRVLALDASPAIEGENLYIVSAETLHWQDMLFDSTGLPGMTIQLNTGGRAVLRDSLALICHTRCPDGQVRPEIWRYVDDLSSCSKRDRVFTYEAPKERLVFGDGENGAIVPRGERAVLVASLALSHCSQGNIPAGELTFSDGRAVKNSPASGGREGQTVADAAREFAFALQSPAKCVTAQDYCRCALETPGLRVAAAKALPCYDPEEPASVSRLPIVTVVVIPASPLPLPMPDERFLQAVKAHLESSRPICTVVKVVPPRYLPVGVAVGLKGSAKAAAEVKKAVRAYFKLERGGRGIGDAVVKNDLITRVAALEEVYRVTGLTLSPMGGGGVRGGDVTVPPGAVAYLGALDVEVK